VYNKYVIKREEKSKMKTKLELSITISPEEREILQKAESILEEICLTFDEHNQCDICPMHTICQEKLNFTSTPQNILYHICNTLDVEEE